MAKKLFVAMPIAPEYDDVLDAIRTVATELGIEAIRIDQEQSNEKISDRIIQHIQRSDIVLADLTARRPNVFFEAGFALGNNKTPIFIARKNTELDFDIHDYPVIFFERLVDLKRELQKRLTAIQLNPITKSAQPGNQRPSGRKYSEEDKKALLKEWVSKQMKDHKFGLVDYELTDREVGLESGETKRLIVGIVTRYWSYAVDNQGEHFVNFIYRSPPPRRHVLSSGLDLTGY